MKDLFGSVDNPAVGFARWLVLATLLFSVSAAAKAIDDHGPGDWQFDASAYLWGASIAGDSASGGEIDIGFIDILNNLDMALMGHFSAAKGKWRLSTDVIFMDVSATNGDDRLTVRPGLVGFF